MGVPKFFRWLTERYPLILQPIVPNEVAAVDNFYLDMNGIIHRCTHPGDESVLRQPTEKEAMLAVFQYIEKLFNIMQPQKIFYMALDGCAPRAKMNQQRQRRFRTAQERVVGRQQAQARGEDVPDDADTFDSNCITPGTEFMARLTEHLKYFIRMKISTDVAWQKCEVIFSGHEVPGEGEHKVMEFIRCRRSQPEYPPNESHCLYGLDADLIMLGLASHEPHFSLLREEVKFLPPRAKDKENAADKNQSSRSKGANAHQLQSEEKFFLMHLCLVREYFDMEFSCFKSLPSVKSADQPLPFNPDDMTPRVPPGSVYDESMQLIIPPNPNKHPENMPNPLIGFAYDLERIIDDFVIMCFFVGNDFLPHLPTLDIGEGALTTMFYAYKTLLPQLGGYLTESGKINFDRVQQFFALLSEKEQKVLDERAKDRVSFNRKSERESGRSRNGKHKAGKSPTTPPAPAASSSSAAALLLPTVENTFSRLSLSNGNGKQEEEGIPSAVFDDAAFEDEEDEEDEDEAPPFMDVLLDSYDSENQTVDISKWRRAYYASKLGFHIDDEEAFEAEMKQLKRSYIEGLMWVEQYYYNGCVSWNWFYPFHYSPLCSDLVTGLSDLAREVQFELGQPFLPFDQLLGVLPSLSDRLLPSPYRSLMSDISSPIVDFYPLDFKIDKEGRKAEWEGVVLVPFIEEQRLQHASRSVNQAHLTSAERDRNTFGVTFSYTFDPQRAVDLESAAASGRSILDGLGKPLTASSLPNIFPDIKIDRSRCEIYNLPPCLHGFEPRLLDGCRTGARAPQGYPTFSSRWHMVAFEKARLQVFQGPSRNESCIITVFQTDLAGNNVATRSRQLVGQIGFVGYPYATEGLISSLSDSGSSAFMPPAGSAYGSPAQVESHTDEERKMFLASLSTQKHNLKTRYGLDIGECSILIYAQKFDGMRKDPQTGNIVKSFSRKEACFPIELIHGSAFRPLPDARFQARAASADVRIDYPLGSSVAFMGEDMNYFGLSGAVFDVDKGNRSLVVRLIKDDLSPLTLLFSSAEAASSSSASSAGFTAAEMALYGPSSASPAAPSSAGSRRAAGSADRYYSSKEASRMIDCSPLTLGRIAGAVFLNDKTSDIGIGVKFGNTSKRIPGYSRKSEYTPGPASAGNRSAGNDSTPNPFDGTGSSAGSPAAEANSNGKGGAPSIMWEYSQKCIDLLIQYKRLYPEVFAALDAQAAISKPGTKVADLDAKALFPAGSTKTVASLLEWLSSLPHHSIPAVHVDSESVHPTAISRLESLLESSEQYKTLRASSKRILTVGNVSPNCVYKLGDPLPNPDANSKKHFQLWDRVVSIAGNASKVPFGYTGTIIGLNLTTCDVLFDDEFLGATGLQGRCTSLRGATVAYSTLLNLTRPFTRKMKQPVKLIGETKPASTSGVKYAAVASTPAPTPAPIAPSGLLSPLALKRQALTAGASPSSSASAPSPLTSPSAPAVPPASSLAAASPAPIVPRPSKPAKPAAPAVEATPAPVVAPPLSVVLPPSAAPSVAAPSQQPAPLAPAPSSIPAPSRVQSKKKQAAAAAAAPSAPAAPVVARPSPMSSADADFFQQQFEQDRQARLQRYANKSVGSSPAAPSSSSAAPAVVIPYRVRQPRSAGTPSPSPSAAEQ